MFNEYQVAEARYLNSLPPEKKCWCGWYRFGECPKCNPAYTEADRLRVTCPDCGNYPRVPGEKMVHCYGCITVERKSQMSTQENESA
jgi:hypothetical protein